MKNKKNIIYITIAIFSLIIISTILYINKTNLIELNYSEIIEKIENKDTFVLCISATNCVHCQDYKPKLEKISKDYDITIYYINKDTIEDEKYREFKSKLSFDGGTPTTIFFINGEEKTTANRIEGNVRTEKIINKLKNNGFITE